MSFMRFGVSQNENRNSNGYGYGIEECRENGSSEVEAFDINKLQKLVVSSKASKVEPNLSTSTAQILFCLLEQHWLEMMLWISYRSLIRNWQTSETVLVIDGILLTKFDCIDDKVGAALSMVYMSGSPVTTFVGCGQFYTDRKKLNVKSIVKILLK